MNQKKLQDYSLTGSIHTLSVRTDGVVSDIQDEVLGCIVPSTDATKKETTTTTCIINANKLMGDLFSYVDFETALSTILVGAGIEDYKIVRADMRFDSYDPDHYRRFEKLNRYLISALAVVYNVDNCYRSTDLFSQAQLSIAVKNSYFEAENYDKNAESNGTDSAFSRLELRSKRWSDKDFRKEFVDHWFLRLDKALANIDETQRRYNAALIEIYNRDRNAYPHRFRSVTDFLMQYQDSIFCRRQLIQLLSEIPEVGAEKAKNFAENYKKRHGIEYISKGDVKRAIDEIKRATLAFFDQNN